MLLRNKIFLESKLSVLFRTSAENIRTLRRNFLRKHGASSVFSVNLCASALSSCFPRKVSTEFLGKHGEHGILGYRYHENGDISMVNDTEISGSSQNNKCMKVG